MNGKGRMKACSGHRNHLIRENQTVQKNHSTGNSREGVGAGVGVIVGCLTSFLFIPR